jgi:tetratricopeptide (TPR) repeat protein
MNSLSKQDFYYLFILSVLLLISGCKSETDNMMSEGTEKFENADFAGAAKIYSEIIQKDSTKLEAYFKLASANACIHNNQKLFMKDLIKGVDAAFKVYKSLKKIPGLKVSDNDDVSKILAVRAEVFSVKSQIVNLGDMPWSEKEICLFTNTIEKHPKNSKLYFGRGLWFSVQGNVNNSISDFTSAIDLDKKFIQAYLARGRNYFIDSRGISRISPNFGNYNSKRIFDFKRALNIDPNNTETLYEIGMSYVMSTRYKTAIEYLNRLLSIEPDNYEAISLRVLSKTIIGDSRGAIEDLSVLVKKFPNNFEYLNSLAVQKILIGKKKEGLRDLIKAKELCKDLRVKRIIQASIDRYSSR